MWPKSEKKTVQPTAHPKPGVLDRAVGMLKWKDV
jgi:hypothetical protein